MPEHRTASLNRRQAVTLVAGAAAATAFPGRARAAPRDVLFDVFRKGSRIGTHAIQFRATGTGLQVTSRLDLAVKVAFITAYRYEQTGEDEWRDDVLVRTRIQTNDDGNATLVEAEARGGELAVQGPTGTYVTGLGAMTDLSFWNQAITRGRPLIDSQSGELIEIEVKTRTDERLQMLGRTVEAERFAMAATRGRSGTVWYDADGNLVKAVVLTRGETLNYELAA
jgi:Family of unknown function (DUF6134)